MTPPPKRSAMNYLEHETEASFEILVARHPHNARKIRIHLWHSFRICIDLLADCCQELAQAFDIFLLGMILLCKENHCNTEQQNMAVVHPQSTQHECKTTNILSVRHRPERCQELRRPPNSLIGGLPLEEVSAGIRA